MENNKPKKFFSILGIIVGIIIIILGISNFNYTYNGTVSREYYGGDAYTGIQQASAQTATNVYNFYIASQEFYRFSLIILGVLVTLHYCIVLCDCKKNSNDKSINNVKNENKNIKNENIDVNIL